MHTSRVAEAFALLLVLVCAACSSVDGSYRGNLSFQSQLAITDPATNNQRSSNDTSSMTGAVVTIAAVDGDKHRVTLGGTGCSFQATENHNTLQIDPGQRCNITLQGSSYQMNLMGSLNVSGADLTGNVAATFAQPNATGGASWLLSSMHRE